MINPLLHQFTEEQKISPLFRDALLDDYAENTIESYESSIAQYLSYCRIHNHKGDKILELETIEDYITDASGYYKLSNLKLFVYGLRTILRESGIDDYDNIAKSESISRLFKRIARKNGQLVKRAKALTLDTLISGIDEHIWNDSQIELRNMAMILVGFYGALRRSEILNLRYEDLEYQPGRGYTILIRSSKSDQFGEGIHKAIPEASEEETPFCPCVALNKLIAVRGKHNGFLFTKGKKGGDLTDKKLTPKGFDYNFKAIFPFYSSHSLRSGFITSAFQLGVSEQAIMNQTGQKDPRVVRMYNRPESVWVDNAVTRLKRQPLKSS